mmetsp:Transcript_50423/g.80292  ORF Transcript_50423/g.80292 Transcript_50423/m.80292 type:complete len:99 (+) Transcript_50423:85-381(+)
MMGPLRSCDLVVINKNAAAFIPTDWIKTEASRDSDPFSWRTSTAIGNATTPPPKGVEPAINEPRTIPMVAGQYVENTEYHRFLVVIVKNHMGHTNKTG